MSYQPSKYAPRLSHLEYIERLWRRPDWSDYAKAAALRALAGYLAQVETNPPQGLYSDLLFLASVMEARAAQARPASRHLRVLR